MWSKLPQDKIIPTQQQVLDALLLTTEDGEWVVRYAAIVGLESLSKTLADSQPKLLAKITARFQQLVRDEPEAAICARIKYAIEKLER